LAENLLAENLESGEAVKKSPSRGMVPSLRLRTRFLLSMLLITAGLTTTSLLLVRRMVEQRVRENIAEGLQNSVQTFQNFQQERESLLTRLADLLADLPITRALMTTHDPATIQDASQDLWQIAASDLLVLADRRGVVVALHTKGSGITRDAAQAYFAKTLQDEEANRWWYGGHHLYQIFVQPIYFGSRTDGSLLGFLIIGDEIDAKLAREVSKVAASQVAFSYNGEILATTLAEPQAASETLRALVSAPSQSAPSDVRLGTEHYLETSLELSVPQASPVRLTVLGSYDKETQFLSNLNRLLLALGLAAVLIGSVLVFFLSHTFTRPLADLVGGVRALERGDFHHPLDSRGNDEVAELTGAFDRMRTSLLKTQRDLLEAEQLATIGRMASSISHDLRHSLSAITANAEFLCESGLSREQKEDLYQEVRAGVNRMTDLIDSLLEFARTRESLNPSYGNVREPVRRVVQAVRTHPRHQRVLIEESFHGSGMAWFDSRKLERALYNLVLNACDAAPETDGEVRIEVGETVGGTVIEVSDNGPGIAVPIRDRLFQPFVSYGKENGTGLGLTVVQKIVHDHGGKIETVRRQGKTIFRIVLPVAEQRESQTTGAQGLHTAAEAHRTAEDHAAN
jgi:signal transduction histidine kinase